MLHEIVSPGIHLDIAVINPNKDRDYFTLVTMGMGAHMMNIPQEVKTKISDRAELVICLPSDWQIHNKEEKWYWPIRWLKRTARLPIDEKSWVGWGHSIISGKPFADNTKLSGMLVLTPGEFRVESVLCHLSNNEHVMFYQIVPLFEEEMQFKITHSVEELLDRFEGDFSNVNNINRKNYCLEQ